MNKPQVLFDLQAAHYELGELIKKVENDVEHDGFPQFYALLPFVYRKLNLAWNTRDMSHEQVFQLTDAECKMMCRFPEELAAFVSD